MPQFPQSNIISTALMLKYVIAIHEISHLILFYKKNA